MKSKDRLIDQGLYLFIALVFIYIAPYILKPPSGPLRVEYSTLVKHIPDLKDIRGHNAEREFDILNLQKPVVFLFLSQKCLCSPESLYSIRQIYQTYKNRGISLVGINEDPSEDGDALIRFYDNLGFEFLILNDVQHQLAKALNLHSTPYSLFVDKNGYTLYQGAVSIEKWISKEVGFQEENHLEQVLNRYAHQRPIERRKVSFLGCAFSKEVSVQRFLKAE